MPEMLLTERVAAMNFRKCGSVEIGGQEAIIYQGTDGDYYFTKPPNFKPFGPFDNYSQALIQAREALRLEQGGY